MDQSLCSSIQYYTLLMRIKRNSCHLFPSNWLPICIFSIINLFCCRFYNSCSHQMYSWEERYTHLTREREITFHFFLKPFSELFNQSYYFTQIFGENGNPLLWILISILISDLNSYYLLVTFLFKFLHSKKWIKHNLKIFYLHFSHLEGNLADFFLLLLNLWQIFASIKYLSMNIYDAHRKDGSIQAVIAELERFA